MQSIWVKLQGGAFHENEEEPAGFEDAALCGCYLIFTLKSTLLLTKQTKCQLHHHWHFQTKEMGLENIP